MTGVVATQPTTAAPEQVWAVVTDLDRAVQRLSAVLWPAFTAGIFRTSSAGNASSWSAC